MRGLLSIIVFGVALTFLQLCHHVVVLEEGLAAEGVGQQHLEGAGNQRKECGDKVSQGLTGVCNNGGGAG